MQALTDAGIITISIHAPRKGERPPLLAVWGKAFEFQSTLPARGSDFKAPAGVYDENCISIHAPRKGERHGKPLT